MRVIFIVGYNSKSSFWSFYSRLALKPQVRMEYCKCGRTRELYNMRNIRPGRKFLSRHIAPNVLAILFFWDMRLPSQMLINGKSKEIKFRYAFNLFIIYEYFRY